MAITGETVFFGKTYADAVALLVEARDYLSHVEPRERRGRPPVEGLAMCAETLRLTARLIQIMAWLLAQRAIHNGETMEADVEPLDRIDVCMEGAEHEDADLPPRLCDLLGRSRRLYVRVARLDELTRRAISA